MKKVIMILAMMSGVTFGAIAQDGNQTHKNFDPMMRATKMADRLKTELKLNDEQYAAVLKLNTEKATQRMAEFKAMKAKREAERADFAAQMKQIVSPEQYKIYEAKMAAREDKMKDEFRKHHGKRKM